MGYLGHGPSSLPPDGTVTLLLPLGCLGPSAEAERHQQPGKMKIPGFWDHGAECGTTGQGEAIPVVLLSLRRWGRRAETQRGFLHLPEPQSTSEFRDQIPSFVLSTLFFHFWPSPCKATVVTLRHQNLPPSQRIWNFCACAVF